MAVPNENSACGVEMRIGHEAIAVRHLHFRQALTIELAVGRHNAVPAQDVRGERISVVIAH
ncbi:hypothetical protein FHS76_003565 [Ochrobactrum daejeonense]|uniref:Uncharacterized protein n=1 Tax=Brucella daejeonensis TaxID=659015 RepID=A0A7W9B096_9HYPH|nr:hypothetical protein [Brucella daejeonensis]MBB5703656.1 hypothetical protein [Brucella daejeonensis]